MYFCMYRPAHIRVYICNMNIETMYNLTDLNAYLLAFTSMYTANIFAYAYNYISISSVYSLCTFPN